MDASAGAATTGKDVVENDAQSSADFLNRIDKATAFVTRSVLCVVLLEPAPDGEATGGGVGADGDEMRTRAVIQLINKKGSDDSAGSFGEGDKTLVREEAGPSILQSVNSISLHQLLTRPALAA